MGGQVHSTEEQAAGGGGGITATAAHRGKGWGPGLRFMRPGGSGVPTGGVEWLGGVAGSHTHRITKTSTNYRGQ